MAVHSYAQRAAWIGLASLICLGLTGCIAVGYSSGSGWFVWPGGLGLLFLLLLLLLLIRHR